jgi:hypothetical protein
MSRRFAGALIAVVALAAPGVASADGRYAQFHPEALGTTAPHGASARAAAAGAA